ncbi:hypothetical protein NL386_37650, partial [Klebsiella pneumoniae]|nr:hypothetical protein [Klebsiella pneumoniae]
GDTDTVWFFGLGGGSLYYGLLEQGGKTYWMAPWMETDSYYWESDTSMRYFDKNGEMLEAKQGWNTYAYTSEYEGTVTKWYYGNGDGT